MLWYTVAPPSSTPNIVYWFCISWEECFFSCESLTPAEVMQHSNNTRKVKRKEKQNKAKQ